MTLPLTCTQNDIYRMIKQYIKDNGFPPSNKEIAEAIGFSSPNAAAEQLKKIEQKGFITIAKGVPRGIKVLQV